MYLESIGESRSNQRDYHIEDYLSVDHLCLDHSSRKTQMIFSPVLEQCDRTREMFLEGHYSVYETPPRSMSWALMSTEILFQKDITASKRLPEKGIVGPNVILMKYASFPENYHSKIICLHCWRRYFELGHEI